MKKYILLAVAAFSLAACNSEDNYIDEQIAARFTATIGADAPSRASETDWAPGDNIGITMNGRYLNFKYTTAGTDGVFSGPLMYFRNKQDKEAFTAYYPYTGSEGTAPEIITASTGSDNQTPEAQAKFDFLYASLEDITGAAPNVNLTFSHKMSKLTFVFKNGNDGTDVSKITTCEISGLVLEGSFNPVTGDCAASASAEASPLTFAPAVEHEKTLPPLILFPQSVGKVTMKITDSEEQEYSCELRFSGDHLLSGNNYLYTIVVKKTGLSIEQYAITDWTDITDSFEGESE